MSKTQPIKNLEELEELKNYYITSTPNIRNALLIELGVNTTLRISDLLQLTWNDVYDFETKSYRTHICIQEQKTGKNTCIALNSNAIKGLKKYRKIKKEIKKEMYLFSGRKEKPLSRSQAFRIIKNASNKLHLEGNISCHSLRKTFGYHAWKRGAQPALLMNIYNHSSYQITKRYLGIDQDDKDEIFLKLNL